MLCAAQNDGGKPPDFRGARAFRLPGDSGLVKFSGRLASLFSLQFFCLASPVLPASAIAVLSPVFCFVLRFFFAFVYVRAGFPGRVIC